MTIKMAQAIPYTSRDEEQASVMVGQGCWRESWQEVVRLMSTVVFAFTFLWGMNNGYPVFLCRFYTFRFLFYLFVSLSLVSVHVWDCLCHNWKWESSTSAVKKNPLTLMRSQPLFSLQLFVIPSFVLFFSSFSFQQCCGEPEESLILPWQLLGFRQNKCFFCTKHWISISTSICMI